MNNKLQQMLQSMINNSPLMRNPTVKNAVEMGNKGDFAGAEKLARNVLKERGYDPDKMYQEFVNRFR